jgi:hypothetical protein
VKIPSPRSQLTSIFPIAESRFPESEKKNHGPAATPPIPFRAVTLDHSPKSGKKRPAQPKPTKRLSMA